MTDSGYNVFWNEPTLDGLPQGKAERRHFVSKRGGEEFLAELTQDIAVNHPEMPPPRMYEQKHTSPEQQDVANRDNTDVQNRRRLVEQMLEHNITIPAKQFDK